MAFTPSTLSVILQTIGGVGMRFVSYRSDDAIATLTGTGYFASGTDYGLRLHDLIFVSPVSGSVEPYVLVVTAVDSSGNVTAEQTAFDALLTMLAGLTPDADKIPYFTSATTAALLDFKDEDDMASDSATAVPSQQSLVSYTIPRFDAAADLEAVTPASRVGTVLVAGQAYERITASYWGLGPNVFTLGDMSTAAGLTLTGAWAVTGGVAEQTTTGAGTVRQVDILEIGQAYFTSFDIVTVSAGGACVYAGSGAQGAVRTTAGTHEQVLVCAGDDDGRLASNSTFVGSADNVTMQALPSTAIMDASGAWWGPVEGLAAFAQEEGDRRIWDLKARGQEVLMVADYWKVGEADFGPALGRIAALSDDNLCIVLPRAEMPLNTQATFTDKNVSIVGRGTMGSRIVIEDAAGQINFLCTDTTGVPDTAHKFEIANFSAVVDVVSAAGAGPVPINATWSYTSSAAVERFKARDVIIRASQSGRWWQKGIRLVDAAHVDIAGVQIYNADGHQTCLSPAAIEMVRDNASNVTGFFMDRFWLGRCLNGVLWTQKTAGAGTIEGAYISNGEIVNAAYGFHEDNDTEASISIDSVTIEGVHVSASRASFKAGRVRGLKLLGNHWFNQDFGEPGVAPLEAAVNILLQCDGLGGGGNSFTRFNTITDVAPCFLLPTAASLNWVRIEGNQISNYEYVVASHGTETVTEAKCFIGKNTLVSTPVKSGMGFQGHMTTIGANFSALATGTRINFPHAFTGAPAVVVAYRGSTTTIKAWPDSVDTTGFTLRHDGGGTINGAYVAVGT